TPEPMPAPVDAAQQQDALASRLQQQQFVQMKMGTPTTEPIAQNQSAQLAQVNAVEGRIVVKQVTRAQAVALQTWLDQRQGRPQLRDEEKNQAAGATTMPSADALVKLSNETKAGANSEAMSSLPIAGAPTTEPAGPATMPLALGTGLSEVLDFSPP